MWLKEGFATFMAYVEADAHYPELTVWVDFVNRRILNGLATDSFKSSHPIEVWNEMKWNGIPYWN